MLERDPQTRAGLRNRAKSGKKKYHRTVVGKPKWRIQFSPFSRKRASMTHRPLIRMKNVFLPFLTEPPHVAILDGGLTTSLPNDAEKHFLWGHQLLYGMEGGLESLKQVHRNFLENGADIIGTLTYKLSAELIAQCQERGLLEKLPKDVRGVAAEVLLQRAVQTAIQARDEFWAAECRKESKARRKNKPLVFACCGPFVDSTKLFRGATDPNTRCVGVEDLDEMRAYYKRKLKTLKDAKPDGIAVETLAGLREAFIAADAIQELKIPGWISFCCKDAEHTTSGERLEDCARALVTSKKLTFIQGIGVNCFHPKDAPALVRILRGTIYDNSISSSSEETEVSHKPVVIVYPNSGEKWDASAENRCWHGGEEMKYLTGEDAAEYKEAGANIIGGCCRVGPSQIQLFRAKLHSN